MPYVETSRKDGKEYLIFDLDELNAAEKALYDAQAAAYKAAGEKLKAFQAQFSKRQGMAEGVIVSCRYGRVNVYTVDGSKRRKARMTKPKETLQEFLARQVAA